MLKKVRIESQNRADTSPTSSPTSTTSLRLSESHFIALSPADRAVGQTMFHNGKQIMYLDSLVRKNKELFLYNDL